ncbi:MAG: helix-turn-helix domain-containing protein [Ruminococcus sp.]|nr:helix-turn-helix domain-containing protein [Ruminococcus sp.]
MNNIPVMLGIKETADTWNITPNYARSLALSGKVAAVRVGRGKILINQQSVADYFNSSHLSKENVSTDPKNITPIPVKV